MVGLHDTAKSWLTLASVSAQTQPKLDFVGFSLSSVLIQTKLKLNAIMVEFGFSFSPNTTQTRLCMVWFALNHLGLDRMRTSNRNIF